MFNIQPLLDPSFWFNTTPPPLQPENEKILFAFFAIMLVLGAIIRMVGTRRKEDKHVTEVFNRIGKLFVTTGLWGLVLFLFAFERIPFFSARFWYIILACAFLAWLGMILYFIFKVIPKEKSKRSEEIARDKYLPKKKA